MVCLRVCFPELSLHMPRVILCEVVDSVQITVLYVNHDLGFIQCCIVTETGGHVGIMWFHSLDGKSYV